MLKIPKIRSFYNPPKLRLIKRTGKPCAAYSSPSITETRIKENFQLRVSKFEEETNLFQQIKAGGTEAVKAKETLIKRHEKIVFSIARKYLNWGMEFEDLVQEGYVGLLKAIKKFEPERGWSFATLAYWWIRAGIGNAVRMKAEIVRLPKRKADLGRYLRKLSVNYRSLTGKYPTPEQFADMFDLPLEKVKELFSEKIINLYLENPVFKNVATSPTWNEQLPDSLNFDLETAVIAQLTLRRFLNTLPPDHKRVLELLYRQAPDYPGREMNLREAGEIMGISRQGVQQKSERAIEILRKKGANSHRLSPYKKWSNDEKAINLMMKSLNPQELKIFELTFNKWITRTKAARLLNIPGKKVTEQRRKLEKKLDKMYEIILRERRGLNQYSPQRIRQKN